MEVIEGVRAAFQGPVDNMCPPPHRPSNRAELRPAQGGGRVVEACSLVRPSSQALLGTGVAAPHPARPGRTGVSLSKRPRAG